MKNKNYNPKIVVLELNRLPSTKFNFLETTLIELKKCPGVSHIRKVDFKNKSLIKDNPVALQYARETDNVDPNFLENTEMDY